MWAGNAFLLEQREKGDDLDGLSQSCQKCQPRLLPNTTSFVLTHFISQNTADLPLKQQIQPIQPNQLIVLQLDTFL